MNMVITVFRKSNEGNKQADMTKKSVIKRVASLELRPEDEMKLACSETWDNVPGKGMCNDLEARNSLLCSSHRKQIFGAGGQRVRGEVGKDTVV